MSNTQKPSRKVRFLLYFSIFTLMGLAVFQEFKIETLNQLQNQVVNPYGRESIPLKGQIEVFIDGKSVYKDHNVIQIYFYDFIGCQIFNVTTCNLFVESGPFGPYNNYTAVAMQLSTNGGTPLSSETSCDSAVTVPAGLTQKRADTVTQTFHSNSIVLTTTWVNSSGATFNGIGRVCLHAYHSILETFSTIAFAAASFTPQSLGNGQSITIQWTFSF